jgi:DNA-binding CsgD family transcriptional regulator
MIYGAVAVLSVLLFVGYVLWDRKEKPFLALFGCIACVNSGYFLLSVSGSLSFAMAANALSYFGAAYSVLVMLLIICDVCQVQRKRWVNALLLTISTVAFALAASGDWLGLYYRAVSLDMSSGISRLVKDYGPLHSLYTVYLLSYTVTMMAVIFYAAKKKRLASPKYAMFLFMTVFLNLGVWAVEQLIIEEFELLSVSYIVTAVLLLLIYGVLRDYGIIRPNIGLITVQMLNAAEKQTMEIPSGMEDMFTAFAQKVKTLSTAERRILGYYIDGHEIADIPELAFISIHTVKKHNRSIYQKLEVASRDELMLYIELFRRCDRLDELTDAQLHN